MSDAGNMGSSDNTGNTTGIRPIHGKGSGIHFSNEELLAYLHKDVQGSTLWNIQHQHISNCSTCRTQLDELEQSEQLLKVSVHSSYYSFYPSITNTVMDRISGSAVLKQPSYRSGTGGSRHLRLVPVALVAAVLLIITFGMLLTKLPTSQGHTSVSTSPEVKSIGLKVRQHFSATQTAVPTTVPVATVVKPVGAIRNCTSGSDQQKQHLRICGSYFVAGDNVVFTLVNSNGKIIKLISSIQVLADGTFVQNISIHSCKDVPSLIYAQDISVKTPEKAVTLSIIRYGKC